MGGRRTTYKKRTLRRGGSHSRRAAKEVDLSVVSSSHPEVIAIVEETRRRYNVQITKAIIDYCVQKVNTKTAEEYRTIARDHDTIGAIILKPKYNEDIQLLLYLFDQIIETGASVTQMTRKKRVEEKNVNYGIEHDEWVLKILFA